MEERTGMISFIVNIICLILLIGNVIYLISVWGSLPDQIPAHFDFAGNVTRYDSKRTLLLMPVFNWIIFISLAIIERFPNMWNTGVKITEKNKERVYGICRNMIITLKLITVVIFLFISVHQTTGTNLPGWYLPVLLSVIFGPLIFFIIKLFRER